jgi:flagellar basal-body rod protein FlgC
MMDIKSVYDIAGRAMAAQLVRLNTVASNLANAGSTTGDPKTTYKPLKPAANEAGYIFKAAVNVDEEMVDMMEASRQYQNNVEVVTTLRALTMRTLQIGK